AQTVLRVGRISGSAPNNHFCAGPDCCVSHSRGGSVERANWRPSIGVWIVPAASVIHGSNSILSTPHYHFTSRPHVWEEEAANRSVDCANRRPTIRNRIVPTAGGTRIGTVTSAPDNHFV